MNKGVIWEDIQTGKLYTPFLSHAIVGYNKLVPHSVPFDIKQNNVALLLEAGEPILVISRYFEHELKHSWVRILKEDKAFWIRYETSFLPFQPSE